MKMKDPSGAVFTKSTRPFPPPWRSLPISGRTFPTSESFQILVIEPSAGVFKLAINLDAGGEDWVYTYPVGGFDEGEQIRAKLLRDVDEGQGELTGGELFNYGIRSTCDGKFPE